MSLLLGLFTFILVLICFFLVLVILMQRAKSDGGVGAALGGGVTEAAFGAEGSNVLTRATNWAAVAFFVIAFGLYLGRLYQHHHVEKEVPASLPSSPDLIAAPEDDTVSVPMAAPEVPAAASAIDASPADATAATVDGEGAAAAPEADVNGEGSGAETSETTPAP